MPLLHPVQRDEVDLADAGDASDVATLLTDRTFRKHVERLVEVLIEMLDLADNDSDAEQNGDEFEDSDGL